MDPKPNIATDEEIELAEKLRRALERRLLAPRDEPGNATEATDAGIER